MFADLLHRRDFRWLTVGRSVSLIGNAMAPVAVAFAVLDLTGSAADLGVVVAARSVANVVVVLAGGVLADRLPLTLTGFTMEQAGIAWDLPVQEHVPADRLARVYAYDAFGSFVAIPLGQVAAGPAAAAFGTGPPRPASHALEHTECRFRAPAGNLHSVCLRA